MKSIFSYLIVIIAVLYWIFRVVVSLMYSMSVEFICQPLNPTIEIVILFLTVPSIIFIIRRNIVAATLYFGMYAAYFGTILFNSLTTVSTETESLVFTDTTSIVFSALGVIIPFLVWADVAIQKSRFRPSDRNTDWYYENDKYNRKFDERADRNQYKIK